MNYIAVKPMKSQGIGFLLILIFGPIGLFYSTITGGIIMSLFYPILFILILVFGNDAILSLLLVTLPFFYIICFIWAYRSISKYNRMDDDFNVLNRIPQNNSLSYSNGLENNKALSDNLSQSKILLQNELEEINNNYANKSISEYEYYSKKEKINNKLAIISHNENSLTQLHNEIINPHFTNSNNYIGEHKKSNLLIWILSVLLITVIIYISYDKGLFDYFKLRKDLNSSPMLIKKSQKVDTGNNLFSGNLVTRAKFKSIKAFSINKSELLNKNNYIEKVLAINTKNENGDIDKTPIGEDRSFLITSKRIYEIENGNIIHKWRIKNIIDDNIDLYVIETYEGTRFYPDGFSKQEPSGLSIWYETENLPINMAVINKEYINE